MKIANRSKVNLVIASQFLRIIQPSFAVFPSSLGEVTSALPSLSRSRAVEAQYRFRQGLAAFVTVIVFQSSQQDRTYPR